MAMRRGSRVMTVTSRLSDLAGKMPANRGGPIRPRCAPVRSESFNSDNGQKIVLNPRIDLSGVRDARRYFDGLDSDYDNSCDCCVEELVRSAIPDKLMDALRFEAVSKDRVNGIWCDEPFRRYRWSKHFESGSYAAANIFGLSRIRYNWRNLGQKPRYKSRKRRGRRAKFAFRAALHEGFRKLLAGRDVASFLTRQWLEFEEAERRTRGN